MFLGKTLIRTSILARDCGTTVELLLRATSLQRPLFFVTVDKKSIRWLLFKTSLQRPLSSVLKVAVVERFNCIWIFILVNVRKNNFWSDKPKHFLRGYSWFLMYEKIIHQCSIKNQQSFKSNRASTQHYCLVFSGARIGIQSLWTCCYSSNIYCREQLPVVEDGCVKFSANHKSTRPLLYMRVTGDLQSEISNHMYGLFFSFW